MHLFIILLKLSPPPPTFTENRLSVFQKIFTPLKSWLLCASYYFFSESPLFTGRQVVFFSLNIFLKHLALLRELQLCLIVREGCYKQKVADPFLERAPLHLDRLLPICGSLVMRWYLIKSEISTLQYINQAENYLFNCCFLLSCISLWVFLLFF